jgi:hypothetical protein
MVSWRKWGSGGALPWTPGQKYRLNFLSVAQRGHQGSYPVRLRHTRSLLPAQASRPFAPVGRLGIASVLASGA